jgi:hypothetical protein
MVPNDPLGEERGWEGRERGVVGYCPPFCLWRQTEPGGTKTGFDHTQRELGAAIEPPAPTCIFGDSGLRWKMVWFFPRALQIFVLFC